RTATTCIAASAARCSIPSSATAPGRMSPWVPSSTPPPSARPTLPRRGTLHLIHMHRFSQFPANAVTGAAPSLAGPNVAAAPRPDLLSLPQGERKLRQVPQAGAPDYDPRPASRNALALSLLS